MSSIVFGITRGPIYENSLLAKLGCFDAQYNFTVYVSPWRTLRWGCETCLCGNDGLKFCVSDHGAIGDVDDADLAGHQRIDALDNGVH